MSTLKVVNLQNPNAGSVNLSLNSDGSSAFSGPVAFPADQTFDIYASAMPPNSPDLGELWYDTSTPPSILKIWDGSSWTSVAGGSGSVTSITAGTGLTGGTITGSGTIGLANTAVTAGGYCFANIVVDAQGRLSFAAAGGASTPTTLGLSYGSASTNGTSGGINAMAVTTGASNTAFGYNTLCALTTGIENAGFGHCTLTTSTTGFNNTAIGWCVMANNTIGNQNTAVGGTTLCCNTSGCRNNAYGRSALRCNTIGNYNTAIGASSLCTNSSGSQNTALGNQSLRENNGCANVAIGAQAMYNNTSGNYNIGVGYWGGASITTGCGNIVIGGYNAVGVNTAVCGLTTENNRIVMGSTSVTNAYIQVAWQAVSDARDKNVEGDGPHGLEFVKALKPVSFRFKESREGTSSHGPLRYGFLAQDILALEGQPGVIIDDTNPEKLTLKGDSLVPVLVNAIQELAKENEQLKARLDSAGL